MSGAEQPKGDSAGVIAANKAHIESSRLSTNMMPAQEGGGGGMTNVIGNSAIHAESIHTFGEVALNPFPSVDAFTTDLDLAAMSPGELPNKGIDLNAVGDMQLHHNTVPGAHQSGPVGVDVANQISTTSGAIR